MSAPIDYSDRDGVRSVRPEGDLDAARAGELWSVLCTAARDERVREVRVDLERVSQLSSAGAAVLARALLRCRSRHKAFAVAGSDPRHEAALDLFPWPPSRDEPSAPEPWLERVGGKALDARQQGSQLGALMADLARYMLRAVSRRERLPRGSLVIQSVVYGVDALPILGLLSFLMGVILTFQASHQLRQFGANVYAVDLVAISMVREFSPMLTGVILAGRSGAAMAAELGTMVVQEELDALRMMGIHPVRYLVLPRLLGLTLTMPALVLMSDFVGVAGGFVIAATRLDIPGPVFLTRTLQVVDFGDWVHGLEKSAVFAALIALAGCYHGLSATKGSAAVGRAATRAVVAGIFLIIVADSVFALATTLSKT